MEIISNVSGVISVVGLLVVLTNIVTQVVKQVTYDKLPTNILAVIVSLVMTLVAFFAYCNICEITVTWYYVVAAVVVGFMTAYAAMFGFDKFKQAMGQIESGDAQEDAETEEPIVDVQEAVGVTDESIDTVVSLSGMTLAELKDTAVSLGIELSEAKTKKEVMEVIVTYLLTGEVGSTGDDGVEAAQGDTTVAEDTATDAVE